MNRRGFLGTLAGLAATAALDPERLLWTPGKKLISVPSGIVKPGLPIGYAISDIPAGNYGWIMVQGCTSPAPGYYVTSSSSVYAVGRAEREVSAGNIIRDTDFAISNLEFGFPNAG